MSGRVLPSVQLKPGLAFQPGPCLLSLLLACAFEWSALAQETTATDSRLQYEYGAVIRGDTAQKKLSLVFTGDEFADGGPHIRSVLNKHGIKAAFFFTGNFYRNPAFANLIENLVADGHYLGAHSDRHLLYCSWENRDSLLVTKTGFLHDLAANYKEMERFGVRKEMASFFLPPYEWYNDSISAWTKAYGLRLINFSRGTRSHADYTTPEMKNYHTSEQIYNSILKYEQSRPHGLNGFILLSHIGTAPMREDKFYLQLESLIIDLTEKGYDFVRLENLLEQ